MGLKDLFPRKEDNNESSTESADWGSAVKSVRVLYVEDDETDQFILSKMLAELGADAFRLTCAQTFAQGVKAIRNQTFDVYLLDQNLGERTGLDLLREELDDGAKGPAILLTGAGDRGTDLEAMRRGAAGYIVKGELDARGLERAIRYAMHTHRSKYQSIQGSREGSDRATVAVFLGARGGVGTSTTAVNVAVAAADEGRRRVILLDLRAQYGSLADLLSLEATKTSGLLCRIPAESIDGPTLLAHLTSHPSGIKVLAASNVFQDCGNLTPSTAAAIIRAAVHEYELVVIDLPPGLTATSEKVIRMSDHIGVVLDREPTSIHAATLAFEWITNCEARGRAGAIVVDSTNWEAGASSSAVAATLDTELMGYVAAAGDAAAKAVQRGRPIVIAQPSHFISQAMMRLAEKLSSEQGRANRAPIVEQAIFSS